VLDARQPNGALDKVVASLPYDWREPRAASRVVLNMSAKQLSICGTAFMVAGVAFTAAGLTGKSPMFVLGCSFIAIGGAFIEHG
jgi:hypothetical protein